MSSAQEKLQSIDASADELLVLPVFRAETENLVKPPRSRGQSRRAFIKVLTTGLLGVGLSFADLIAKPMMRAAYGFNYTWLTYCPSGHSPNVCVPVERFISNDNCWPGDKWHREGWRNWTNNGIQYAALYTPLNLCGGRNAWNWAQSGYGNAPFGFCSDGWKTRWRLPGWTLEWDNYTICRAPAV